MYVGTTPSQTAEVLRLIRSQVEEIAANGISADELDRAKGHTKGSLAISLEDANSRMTRLGRAELVGLEHLSTDEQVGRYEDVTGDDIRDVAAEVLGGALVLGAAGPFTADELAEHVA